MSEEKSKAEKIQDSSREHDLSARKLEIVEQDIYIDKIKDRRLPKWIIPLIVVFIITLSLIFLVPNLFNRFLAKQATENVVETEEPDPFLREAEAVINQKSVHLFVEPSLRAISTTSAIYNEPVKILNPQPNNGFYQIELADGSQGYVPQASLTFDLISLNSDAIKNKVLLINREKVIASDTVGGNILGTVPMGCLLYADYVTDNVVRVILPGGDVGWMSRENLLVIQADQTIPEPEKKKADIFCSSALMFINVAYVPGGIDMDGIDIPGIVYLSGKTNGLDIPRDMQKQSKQGTQISFERNKDESANIDALKPGDLLFFSLENDPDQIDSSGIYMADGNILYASGNMSSVQIISLANNEKLSKDLIVVKRLFE